jgi:hypothetical protein
MGCYTHEFVDLRSFEIENGRYFSPEESASGKNVALIGSVIAERLFEELILSENRLQ